MLSKVVIFNICIYFVLISSSVVLADKEHVQHMHRDRHYPDGAHDAEFDHEAILGSMDANDDFSKLSAHEAKKRLKEMLKKMDLDGDGFISKSEISDWVVNFFRKQDDKEASEKLEDVDTDSNGRVTWAEYVLKVYNYELIEIEAFKKDLSPEMQTFLKMILDDEDKFNAADVNNDGSLDDAEYGAFLHPFNYDHMYEVEINRTLSEIDRDNDGYVTFDEYMGESRPGREQEIVDEENFKSYDTNNDGRLDRQEIRFWVLPDRYSMAEEEAEHLLSETDADRDGKLTFEEILNRHDLWVGSAATDFGDGLHDPAEL